MHTVSYTFGKQLEKGNGQYPVKVPYTMAEIPCIHWIPWLVTGKLWWSIILGHLSTLQKLSSSFTYPQIKWQHVHGKTSGMCALLSRNAMYTAFILCSQLTKSARKPISVNSHWTPLISGHGINSVRWSLILSNEPSVVKKRKKKKKASCGPLSVAHKFLHIK